MNKIILTMLLVLLIPHTAFTQKVIQLPKLKALIDSLYQVDQQVQEDFIAAFQRGASMDSLKLYEDIKNETFLRHIPLLKKIVKQYLYPTVEQVGKESSVNFFPLIQHADQDARFQSKMLPLIKAQVDKGLLAGWEYAFLYDRIKVNAGKPQLYGTQLTYDNSYNALPKKLKDAKNVNKRRQILGMGPLEEYLEQATEIHKIMNQKD